MFDQRDEALVEGLLGLGSSALVTSSANTHCGWEKHAGDGGRCCSPPLSFWLHAFGFVEAVREGRAVRLRPVPDAGPRRYNAQVPRWPARRAPPVGNARCGMNMLPAEAARGPARRAKFRPGRETASICRCQRGAWQIRSPGATVSLWPANVRPSGRRTARSVVWTILNR